MARTKAKIKIKRVKKTTTTKQNVKSHYDMMIY